jgi:hypothetical protein
MNNNTIPQNLTFYNLLLTSGNTFKIIVVGNLQSSNGNADLLVDIQKQYIGQNAFYSVESSVTNSEGEAIGHLVPSSAVYNFIVSYNGQILGTFNNYQVQCQNPYNLQCSITLNLGQATGTITDFANYGNISQTFLLDNTLHILYHTFVSTDGNSHVVRSLVIKNDGYANNTICDNSVTGTSGTIQCNIPVVYQSTDFYIQTFVDGIHVGDKYFSQRVTPNYYGADIFIELLMFSCLVLLFISHPATIVIGGILGILSSVILLFIAGGSMGTVMATVIFYVVGGIIVIWQIARRV